MSGQPTKHKKISITVVHTTYLDYFIKSNNFSSQNEASGMIME